jgi:uncharacterized damage-inducible protein DinB
MKDFFIDLFDYNHDTNQKIGTVLQANADKASERAIKLYSHIINAHKIWINRIDAKDLPPGVWQIHTVGDCLQIDKSNYEHALTIIDKFDPGQMIDHPNIRGRRFSKTVSDILFNIINHSTYHRGQLATEFRHTGLEPLQSDYIFYEKQ